MGEIVGIIDEDDKGEDISPPIAYTVLKKVQHMKNRSKRYRVDKEAIGESRTILF